MVLYDFGCTKRLAPEVMPGYAELVRVGLAGDFDAVDAQLARMGMRDPSQAPPERSFYERFRAWLLPLVARRESLDFSALRLDDPALAGALPAMWKEMHRFQPSRELVFFERAVGGHCSTLRKLGATVPVQRMLADRVDGVAELLGIAPGNARLPTA